VYNKYFEEDRDAFSDLYRKVENEDGKSGRGEELVGALKKEKRSFELGKLLRGIDLEKVGILPLVLLLLLLVDVDDDEKLIIIALAVIFGI